MHEFLHDSIPILAIVLGITCAMFGMYLDFRKKRDFVQLYHAERMAAIEKGIELPPLPEEYFSGRSGRHSSPARTRRTGLILLFLGIAIMLGLWTGGQDGDTFWLGIVPVGLGLAFLLAAVFEFRELRRSSGGEPPLSGSGRS
jgi:Domain of unknown function (DUF6249)